MFITQIWFHWLFAFADNVVPIFAPHNDIQSNGSLNDYVSRLCQINHDRSNNPLVLSFERKYNDLINDFGYIVNCTLTPKPFNVNVAWIFNHNISIQFSNGLGAIILQKIISFRVLLFSQASLSVVPIS